MRYNLNNMNEDCQYINLLMSNYFQCNVINSRKIGEGFYGVVYYAEIDKEPYRVIIKWYKHSGNNRSEMENLELLKKYSLLKVPDVYFIHSSDQEIPYEALCMEFIEGINAAQLETDHVNRDKFVEQMVNNLLHLHNITNDEGFEYDKLYYSEWKDCYRARIDYYYYAIMNNDVYKKVFSTNVLDKLEKSLLMYDEVFEQQISRSSLIHGDYNLWNILVDPVTANVTAVIDPMDCGWSDKELDLFHLQNADGDRFGLLEYYKKHADLTTNFPVKNTFYWLWDDVKHTVNTGWYDEERYSQMGEKLLDLKDKHIG